MSYRCDTATYFIRETCVPWQSSVTNLLSLFFNGIDCLGISWTTLIVKQKLTGSKCCVLSTKFWIHKEDTLIGRIYFLNGFGKIGSRITMKKGPMRDNYTKINTRPKNRAPGINISTHYRY